MPDSEAVYQPTTVGYTYDTGGVASRGAGGIGGGFLGLFSRRKVSTRKWIEWILLCIALLTLISGLITMLVGLISTDKVLADPSDELQKTEQKQKQATTVPLITTEVNEPDGNGARSSVAVGIALILIGLVTGLAWAWLRFFHRTKSPRSGISSGSGQMLGGLNPSTDLLVGSTSQYGPVLTELPSQLKLKQANSHEAPAIPLSDQEEETRTLMQDSSVPASVSSGPTTIAN